MNSSNSERAWIISGSAECGHDRTVRLGSDKGNNLYFQCQDCKAVIIAKGEYNAQAEREKIEKKLEDNKESLKDKLLKR